MRTITILLISTPIILYSAATDNISCLPNVFVGSHFSSAFWSFNKAALAKFQPHNRFATVKIGNFLTSEDKKYAPENTLIATDWHNVILERKPKMRSIFSWEAVTYLAHADWKPFMEGIREGNLAKANWKFQRINGERKYLEWTKKGLTKPAEFVRSIAQQKEVIPETLTIYKNLNKQGFQMYSATNTGVIFSRDMQKKFPDIFNEHFIKWGILVDYKSNEPIEKPDPRYFEKLKRELDPENKKHIIFIDDGKENINAARNAGLTAIQFDKKQGAKKLAEDLKDLCGIIV